MKRIIRVYLNIDDYISDEEYMSLITSCLELKEAIDRGDNLISTTQTHAITSWLYKTDESQTHLYDDIILVNGRQEIKFSDILAGKYDEHIREIRTAHNWEKMFYAGEFYVPGVFEYKI